MLAAGTTMVVAQNTGYNRVGVSYDNTNYGFNDLMKLRSVRWTVSAPTAWV